MNRLVEFSTASGEPILVETDDRLADGLQPAANDGVVQRSTMAIEAAIAKIRPLAEALMSQLSDLANKPETVEITFGIKLNVAAGILIANTAAEGNCAIKLSWKNAR